MHCFGKKKGMILLQTLVMSVILSMISVMVMQWVLGRYVIAVRTYRSNTTRMRTEGASSNLFTTYFNQSVPASGSIVDYTTDNKVVTYTGSGTRVIFSSVEEQ